MVELIRRLVRYDKIIEALTGWWPHINRLVLGSLSIAAIFVIVVLVIIFK